MCRVKICRQFLVAGYKLMNELDQAICDYVSYSMRRVGFIVKIMICDSVDGWLISWSKVFDNAKSIKINDIHKGQRRDEGLPSTS